MQRVVVAGMGTTGIVYAVLGCLTNLYFGGAVSPVITLNWRGFPWSGALGPLTRAVDAAVVLLPLFTIASAFPLNAHALANNLIASVHPNTWRGLLGIRDAEEPLLPKRLPPVRVKLVWPWARGGGGAVRRGRSLAEQCSISFGGGGGGTAPSQIKNFLWRLWRKSV